MPLAVYLAIQGTLLGRRLVGKNTPSHFLQSVGTAGGARRFRPKVHDEGRLAYFRSYTINWNGQKLLSWESGLLAWVLLVFAYKITNRLITLLLWIGFARNVFTKVRSSLRNTPGRRVGRPSPEQIDYQFQSICKVEFLEDGRQVVAYGGFTDVKSPCDFLIRPPVPNKSGQFTLSWTQRGNSHGLLSIPIEPIDLRHFGDDTSCQLIVQPRFTFINL